MILLSVCMLLLILALSSLLTPLVLSIEGGMSVIMAVWGAVVHLAVFSCVCKKGSDTAVV